MREWQSQSHVRWYCKYHVVFVPKYRKRRIYGALRKGIGQILRNLLSRDGISYELRGRQLLRPPSGLTVLDLL